MAGDGRLRRATHPAQPGTGARGRRAKLHGRRQPAARDRGRRHHPLGRQDAPVLPARLRAALPPGPGGRRRRRGLAVRLRRARPVVRALRAAARGGGRPRGDARLRPGRGAPRTLSAAPQPAHVLGARLPGGRGAPRLRGASRPGGDQLARLRRPAGLPQLRLLLALRLPHQRAGGCGRHLPAPGDAGGRAAGDPRHGDTDRHGCVWTRRPGGVPGGRPAGARGHRRRPRRPGRLGRGERTPGAAVHRCSPPARSRKPQRPGGPHPVLPRLHLRGRGHAPAPASPPRPCRQPLHARTLRPHA